MKPQHRIIRAFSLAFLLALLCVVTVYANPGDTMRISIATGGTQGNSFSDRPSISADGRYVAFVSFASNLVSGDTNTNIDIFIHDRLTSETRRVSVASDGTQANGDSNFPSISADGRYIAFQSFAGTLVDGDTNLTSDVFVHDLQTGQTARVSIASDDTQGNSGSDSPSISADGRYVGFRSMADNLVADDTNLTYDVYVHDRQTGETRRVSIDSYGVQGNNESGNPSISADGCSVAFESDASNLVDNDTNGISDVFVFDCNTGETSRVSVTSDGSQGNDGSGGAAISGDGRYVAFQSSASNLIAGDTNGVLDVFVHDRLTGETKRLSVASDGTQGGSNSVNPSISHDGRYVGFASHASNLVAGDANGYWDIFVHDCSTGDTVRVSIASGGAEANMGSSGHAISAGGGFMAFDSGASNLVAGDTNGFSDVFIHEMVPPVFYTISGNAGGPNVLLSYSENGLKTVTTDENGDYSLEVPSNWSGTVKPSKDGHLFTPIIRNYRNIHADQVSQDYTASLPVTISGNAGSSGVKLTYMIGDVTRTAISDRRGNYSLVVPQGWSGTVIPSKQCGGRNSLTRCYFKPLSRSYTNVITNLKNQNYKLLIVR